jgi:hypothetical protein
MHVHVALHRLRAFLRFKVVGVHAVQHVHLMAAAYQLLGEVLHVDGVPS